jgi:hypothetical protein
LGTRKMHGINQLRLKIEPQMAPVPRTLFQIYEGDGGQLCSDIEAAEAELRHNVEAGAQSRPLTGVPLVDLLVDQFVFFFAARAQASARGLQGLAALEWAEYLSWPECKRQAGTVWRLALLKRYAFEEPSCWWQRALRAVNQGDQVGVGPPRNDVNWFPMGLQFGPYPVPHGPSHWTKKLQVGVLEAHFKYDPWTTPDALFPLRRLDGPLTWQLELWAARKYDQSFHHARVLIDEPRGYGREGVVERLHQIVGDLMGRLQQQRAGLPPHVVDAWKGTIRRWQWTLRDVEQATTTRRRAKALADHTALPLEVLLGEIDVVPEDLRIEWFGMYLGFVLERRGILSARESQRLHQSAEQLVEDWQDTRFPRRRLDRVAAQRIVHRLANVLRPLTGKSVLAYLAKATREAWDRRHGRGTHGR